MITKSRYLLFFLVILSFKTFASDDKIAVAQTNNSNLLALVTPLIGIQNIILGYFKFNSKMIFNSLSSDKTEITRSEYSVNPPLAFSPDSSYLAIERGNSIEIYDIINDPPMKLSYFNIKFPVEKLKTLSIPNNKICELIFSPDGKKIAFSTESFQGNNFFTINTLDLISGERNIISNIELQKYIVQSFSYSNDSKYFAFTDGSRVTILNQKEQIEKIISDSNIKKIRFLDNNQHILIINNMGFCILNWRENRCLVNTDIPLRLYKNRHINTFDYCNKTQSLVFPIQNNIVLWNVKDNCLINALCLRDRESIHQVLFSHCGKYMTLLDNSGVVNLYSASNYALIQNVLKKSALSIAYSPNGQYIACRTTGGFEIIQPKITLTDTIDEQQANGSQTDKNKETDAALVQVNEKNNKVIELAAKAKEEISNCVVCEAPNATVICKRCQKKLYCSLGCRTTDMHTHLENCSSR